MSGWKENPKKLYLLSDQKIYTWANGKEALKVQLPDICSNDLNLNKSTVIYLKL